MNIWYILGCMVNPTNQKENNIGNLARFIVFGVILGIILFIITIGDIK